MPSSDLRIRPWKFDYAQALEEAILESAAELRPWMPWCVPDYGPKETRAFLEATIRGRQEGTSYEFAVFDTNELLLGACGLNGVDLPNKRANLGYWVRTSQMGKGIATAATQEVRDWGFENTDLVRMEIVVALGNRASQRVAEKAGAEREGVARRRLLLYGESHDTVVYSFIRSDQPDP